MASRDTMNKHDELIKELRSTFSDYGLTGDMQMQRDAADLLRFYGDALVRLGNGDYQFREIESPVHEWDGEELQARIEYAQSVVEGEI